MKEILGRYQPQAYALLRIMAALLFMQHGAQKILGLLGRDAVSFPSLLFVAGFIELVGGFLIAVGYRTGFFAFISSGLMAFAYFLRHADMVDFFPIENRGELAVLYCFVFLFISAAGSGIWSIDSLLKERSSKIES